MKAIPSQQFQESLINQYRELIQQAIQESETDHRTQLNIGKLNAKLNMIVKAAAYDGLPGDLVDHLIDQALPMMRAA